MLEKDFTLQGETVTAKELTIGQFKAVQVLLSGGDEIGASALMVSFSIGKSAKEIEDMPMSSINEVTEIANWLGEIVSQN